MSNEPRMVVLQSADGYSFAVEEYVAMEFGILKDLIKNNKTDENTVYPLPGVSRETMSIIIDYCKIFHALSEVASNSHEEVCRHSLNAALAVSCNNGKVESSDKETVPEASVPEFDEKTAVSELEANDKETVAESEGKKAVSEVEASDKETVPKSEEKRVVFGSKENKDVTKGEASDKETVPEIEALLEIKLDKERKAVFVVNLMENESSETETSSGKKVLLKVKCSDEQEVVSEIESSCKIKLLTEENKET